MFILRLVVSSLVLSNAGVETMMGWAVLCSGPYTNNFLVCRSVYYMQKFLKKKKLLYAGKKKAFDVQNENGSVNLLQKTA